MKTAFVIDGVRTPFGKVGGALADTRADDLAAHVISELMARNANVAGDDIDDVCWAATNQAGDDSRNVGRTAAVLAGLPEGVPGFTVNRLCGSGLESAVIAARAIKSGELELCIAGGSESMSRAPFILPRAERSYQRSQPIYDSRLGWRGVNPRWADKYGELTLGECAELTAKTYKVSRLQQDEFALRSHEFASTAWEKGYFDRDVVTIPVTKGVELLRDENIRRDVSMESLSRLSPAFQEGGTVTAGNSSPMNDGAVAMLIASQSAVDRLGLVPRARIVGATAIGVHPDSLEGPVAATRQLLKKIDWELSSVGVIELTEAFASQAVTCVDELDLTLDRVNAWGGAIAIGHPLAASGARLLMTLISRMKHEGESRGIATMCIGVGQGISVAAELVS
jgi:acetyl-CoA acyltransferase